MSSSSKESSGSMIDVHCYLCSSDQRHVKLQQEGKDPYLDLADPAYHAIKRFWYECDSCGFVYRSPVLSDADREQLYERYEEDVFKNTEPDDFFDNVLALPPGQSENYQKSLWLKQTLANLNESSCTNQALLDVGCGSGLLLRTLGDLLGTSRRYGIELNPVYADLASRRSGAEIFQGEFKSGIFNRKFDLVILTKVLEHVPDPATFVVELAKEVSEGGLLFLEVPDVVDFEQLPSDDPRFYIAHIYFFSKITLGKLVERAGLSVLSSRVITTQRNRSYLQFLARKTSPVRNQAGTSDQGGG